VNTNDRIRSAKLAFTRLMKDRNAEIKSIWTDLVAYKPTPAQVTIAIEFRNKYATRVERIFEQAGVDRAEFFAAMREHVVKEWDHRFGFPVSPYDVRMGEAVYIIRDFKR